MRRLRSIPGLFRRQRRPGDFFIALLTFLFALFLLASLPWQTTWAPRTRVFAQPAFRPAVSVMAMVVFSGLHLLGAALSERVPGRLDEVLHWLKAVEYVVWFMVYVLLVPRLGYLPATIVFTTALTFRLGYRGWRWMAAAVAFSVVVVLLFRGLLQVKIPSGALYDLLPPGPVRAFFLTYL